MAISEQITRLRGARDKIRTKLVELGLVESAAKLDACATAIEEIIDNGNVTAKVKEGETYTIPKGYHDGTGTVSGIAGGGNYNLQSKSVTPTKSPQSITPDEGMYGLSDVKVAAIPEAYQDVSGVTAIAADVLATKIIVTPDGSVTAGTMPNNGAVDKTLVGSTPSYTISAGYHNGTGSVKIVPETKTVTPTKEQQTIIPTDGKVLTSVTVKAIPDNYIDTTDADAAVGDILIGKSAYVNGLKVEGSMPNNGAMTKTIDGLTTMGVEIPAGYTTGGTVSLTGDIEAALAEI